MSLSVRTHEVTSAQDLQDCATRNLNTPSCGNFLRCLNFPDNKSGIEFDGVCAEGIAADASNGVAVCLGNIVSNCGLESYFANDALYNDPPTFLQIWSREQADQCPVKYEEHKNLVEAQPSWSLQERYEQYVEMFNLAFGYGLYKNVPDSSMAGDIKTCAQKQQSCAKYVEWFSFVVRRVYYGRILQIKLPDPDSGIPGEVPNDGEVAVCLGDIVNGCAKDYYTCENTPEFMQIWTSKNEAMEALEECAKEKKASKICIEG